MAADDMSDIAVQGRLRLHKGYAQTAELQGLHLSRSAQGRCRRIEP